MLATTKKNTIYSIKRPCCHVLVSLHENLTTLSASVLSWYSKHRYRHPVFVLFFGSYINVIGPKYRKQILVKFENENTDRPQTGFGGHRCIVRSGQGILHTTNPSVKRESCVSQGTPNAFVSIGVHIYRPKNHSRSSQQIRFTGLMYLKIHYWDLKQSY